ncbi:MAG: branched-chain amino acid ABC transporter ATP-binding protein/permease [Clostridiales Family XIII bacterium]|jgi:branched-chain amino acid transport system permease protein|nr:branched-chain amino acid ABC transporter ATP-binding protein/permease [Clostridiales Family XIII bacterium]
MSLKAALRASLAAHPVMWALSALSVAAPFALDSRYYQDIAVMTFLWAGVACAWNLYSGYCRRVSIGHAAFLGIGAYTSSALFLNFGISPWAGMLAGGLLSVAAALLIGGSTLRMRGSFFVLSTIAFAKILEVVAVTAKGVTGGSPGLLIPYRPGLANMVFEGKLPYALICWGYMMLCLAICVCVERSKAGVRLSAIGENREAAESLGVNSSGTMLAAFVASAALTSLGGSIFAQYFMFIEPSSVMGMGNSVNIILLAIAGGMGTAFGPVLGSFILTPLSNLLRGGLTEVSGLHGFVLGVIMIAVLLFRPDGILPQLRIMCGRLAAAFGAGAGAAGGNARPAEAAGPAAAHPARPAPGPARDAGAAPWDGPVLELVSVSKSFGGLKALNGLSLSVREGELLGLIGPNGSGKTTLFDCVTGALPLSGGKVLFRGADISRMKPWEIARAGIARSYQVTQPFGGMSVLGNAMVGAFCVTGDYGEAEAAAAASLMAVGLSHKSGAPAKSLNIGERKKLEIAKALSARPSLLLLDEVMAGLTPTEVAEMGEIVASINRSGVTVVMIEHIMEAVTSLCERVAVLNFGEKIMEGAPREALESPEVAAAYLGAADGS